MTRRRPVIGSNPAARSFKRRRAASGCSAPGSVDVRYGRTVDSLILCTVTVHRRSADPSWLSAGNDSQYTVSVGPVDGEKDAREQQEEHHADGDRGAGKAAGDEEIRGAGEDDAAETEERARDPDRVDRERFDA